VNEGIIPLTSLLCGVPRALHVVNLAYILPDLYCRKGYEDNSASVVSR